MSNPLVSICIPAYNVQSTIAETIQSLLSQTYSHIEIHFVDNASTDNSVQIVEGFADERIIIHRNEKTVSPEENFNRCLKIGEGKYRALYHADDVYHPAMVASAVACFENHSDISAVSTRAYYINQSGKRLGETKTFAQLGLKEGGVAQLNLISLFKLVLRNFNFLVCPSLIMRSGVAAQIDVFRGHLFDTSADLDVWFRLAQISSIALLAKPLISYRLSESQGSYQFNYLRTEPAAIFAVLAYWIDQPEIKKELSEKDYENYYRLQYHDHLRRAVAALIKKEHDLANQLLTQAKVLSTKFHSGFSLKDFHYFGFKCLIVLARVPGFGGLFNKLLARLL